MTPHNDRDPNDYISYPVPYSLLNDICVNSESFVFPGMFLVMAAALQDRSLAEANRCIYT